MANAKRLAELSMVPSLAAEVATQIGNAGSATSLLQPSVVRSTPVPVAVSRTLTSYTLGSNVVTGAIPAITSRIYWNPTNSTAAASDANAGTNRAAPVLTFASARTKAIAAGDGAAIIAFGLTADLIVRETAGWSNFGTTLSIINESLPFRIITVRCGATTAPTWTATGGQPGVYQTALSANDATGVVDFAVKVDVASQIQVPVGGTTADQDRHRTVVGRAPPVYQTYKKVASIAAVAAAPGSWYYDATNIYVQAIDSRNLVGDVRIQPLSNGVYGRAPTAVSNKTLYIKGFDIVGGATTMFANTGTAANTGNLIISDQTSYQAATGANSFSAVGPYGVINYRSTAAFAWNDDWNYHNNASDGSLTPSPSVLEVESIGYGAGTTGSTGVSDNESTAHELSDVTTINCVYLGSSDRVIADVNSARRWILGGYIGAPVDGTGTSVSNYGNGDVAVGLIDGTQFSPAFPGSFNLRSEATAQMLYRNLYSAVTVDRTVSGTYGPY